MSDKEKKGYFQSFKNDYTKEFPFIKASKCSDKSAFCELCRCDFVISHSGRYDIVKHIGTTKHTKNEASSSKSSKLDTFFKGENNIQNDIIRAELLFTTFLVEHNVPIAAADHAGPLFRKMFPKCEIAKQYGSARTKTSALIGEMASTKTQDIVKYMKNDPFTIGCDGSNDSDYKLYPMVVTYFDSAESIIKSSLFSIPNLIGDATGENISKLILEELERYEIPLHNFIAFMADNAYVMQGKKIGVFSFLKQQHNNIIAIGCACHLINLASEKGAATLPIKIDEILIDIFYYLEKSAKRKQTLQNFQALHNKEAKKILKHCSTRWLSLDRSLSRLVEQWDPLVSFFKDAVKSQNNNTQISASLSTYIIPKKQVEENNFQEPECSIKESKKIERKGKSSNKLDKEKASKRKKSSANSSSKKHILSRKTNMILNREEKIFLFLSSEENKAYCLFLLNVLPVFNDVNVTLQSAAPLIHKLRQIYLDLLKELYCRFLKPSIVKNAELISVDYHNKDNQKDVSDLVIGHKTLEIVEQLSEVKKKAFYENVLNFYIVACDYILNKFPINDDTLKNAEVADISKLEHAKFSSIKYFINKFPCMLNAIAQENNDTEIVDKIEKEFCSLQIEDLEAIVEGNKRIDAQWVEIGNLKNASGSFKYKKLSQIMMSILIIPHSNAECERIFSMVKKNRNEFRSSMSNKTLENLLIVKTNSMTPCYNSSFSQEFLKKAKKATSASLNSVSEK